MKKIGVGVIGAGAIAEHGHLPAYAQMPEAHLVAISDINAARCKSLGEKFRVPNCYEDYRTLLENKAVDAVSVCTPPDMHAEIAIAAAQAGKHVLCEKPMAVTVEDTDKMIEAAQKNNVKLMVGHSLRYSENFRTVRRLLADGVVGKAILARLELFSGGPVVWPSVSKFFTRKGAGGGVLLNVGTHAVDLLRWIIGDEVERVCGFTGTYGAVPEMVKNQIEDEALALLVFENGVLGELCLCYTHVMFENSLEICGTMGKIVVELPGALSLDPRRTVRLYRGTKGPYVINVNQPRSELSLEIYDFIDCIRKDKKPKITGLDGKKAVEVVTAIYNYAKEPECSRKAPTT